MNDENKNEMPARHSPFRNWVSLSGLVIAVGSFFSFLLLFVLDALAHSSNPYVGILTYMVAPGFGVMGVCLMVLGIWIGRRRITRGVAPPSVRIDLSRPRDRKVLGLFVGASVVFLLVSAVGSYQTYHYTESVQFCGEACHKVMQPEMTTYHNGPHARVACVECHIGPGAAWFVKAKVSGTYQVYSVLFHKYSRPIGTPIKNLRPAQETCEQCHWPRKFVGDKVKTFDYFLGDETNTFHEVKLMLKVGGADPTHGPVSGIHWHMSVANKIEYIATDRERQKIPWVRVTDQQGVVTEYRSPKFTNDIAGYTIRRMDCIDCHNRPAHRYRSPEDAVNTAMSIGQIDPGMHWIKTNAVFVLAEKYQTEEEATNSIATQLSEKYPGDPRIKPAITAVQQIYHDNFFPEMNASWRNYPENIGHKNWPGCTRCHDDEHTSTDGKKKIIFSNCNQCHIILAQGNNRKLTEATLQGQPFVHPADEIPDGFKCSDCHTGGP
jgi:nitrate/TMAO reductase-like tetraheme cytochrome c subunit